MTAGEAMADEKRRSSDRPYTGRVAADLPAMPIRLDSTGLVILAGAINRMASSVRRLGTVYDSASESEKAYAQDTIDRAVTHISDLWKLLRESD